MVDPTPPVNPDPTPAPDPDPTPDPEPDPTPDTTDETLSATFNAAIYNLTLSTVALKATLKRADGEALTDADKADWTLEDGEGTLILSGTPSITAKGVMTISAKRADATNLDTGTSTVKLVHNGEAYDTAIVNYSPYATITTDSADKLTTDGPEEVTVLKISGEAVTPTDYVITSQTPDIATVSVQEGKVMITPLTGGKATFTVAKPSDLTKVATTTITFTKPAAKIGDTYVKTLAAALKAVKSGETVVLQEDINESVSFVGQTPRVKDFEFTLDLNGHKINAPATASYGLRVDYGTVTLKDSVGTGGITYGKDYAIVVSHVAGDYPSKLIIEGGEYEGKTSVAQVGMPAGSGANYKYYGGDLVIKGGTFKSVPDTNENYDDNGNFRYTLNMLDMVESNYAGGIYSPSSISVEGGEFYKFDPADNVAEGANTNFVADGYQSTKNGDWYTISAA